MHQKMLIVDMWPTRQLWGNCRVVGGAEVVSEGWVPEHERVRLDVGAGLQLCVQRLQLATVHKVVHVIWQRAKSLLVPVLLVLNFQITLGLNLKWHEMCILNVFQV